MLHQLARSSELWRGRTNSVAWFGIEPYFRGYSLMKRILPVTVIVLVAMRLAAAGEAPGSRASQPSQSRVQKSKEAAALHALFDEEWEHGMQVNPTRASR